VTALLGPVEVRRLAEAHAVRPTKTLGQNFLHDPNTIRRIVRSAELAAGEHVLEVGPGLGSLTLGLLEAGARVSAIELDPVLAAVLPSTVAERAPEEVAALRVIEADALRISTVDGDPTALVANLPYNIAVPVVLHLLERVESLRHGLVMVQHEVAERMVAHPGGRIYGVPSVKLAWYASSRIAGSVSRSVFWPVPNVDSSLVAFMRRPPPAPNGEPAPRALCFALVDAAFGQRRKTLRAALAGFAGSPAEAERRLRAAGIEPGARGEQLEVGKFARLAQVWDDLPVPV
jgi:16S rRNA (adenine1518-N6/adenine1519-N6)-dimethyltransferase